jgi:hypothetical protein
MSYVTFTISKSKLLDALNRIAKITKGYGKNTNTIEFTVIDSCINLVVPGINLKLPAITTGSAKFSVGQLYIISLLKSHPEDIVQFTIKEDLVKCNHIAFSAPTTLFETDEILRSIDLPINFINMHMAKLATSGKYTAGEIAFNNLEHQKEEALIMLNHDIDKITYIAQPYGISKKEIEDFIIYKIKESFFS